MVVFYYVLLEPLSHLLKLVDNILILDFHQELPMGSVQQSEPMVTIMRTSRVAMRSDFIALLLGLRMKRVALLRMFALPSLPLLCHAFFSIDVFLGARQKLQKIMGETFRESERSPPLRVPTTRLTL